MRFGHATERESERIRSAVFPSGDGKEQSDQDQARNAGKRTSATGMDAISGTVAERRCVDASGSDRAHICADSVSASPPHGNRLQPRGPRRHDGTTWRPE
jgi:hypothetical protein